MSTQGLAAAVKAALADASAPLFDSDALGRVTVPWVVYSCGLPNVSERSMAHAVHARWGHVLVKAVSGGASGARLLGDEVDAALEGAHLTVAGWTLGPLGLLNVREPEADREVQLTNGAHPIVQVLEYRFTAVRHA